jgi:DNA-binding Lrp family transcriptional regulator
MTTVAILSTLLSNSKNTLACSLIVKERPHIILFEQSFLTFTLFLSNGQIFKILIILKDGGHLWGVRQLAQRVHLDPGFVSRMARELEKRDYITRINSKIKLRNPEGILDDWVRNYNFNKNKNYNYFLMATSSIDVLEKLRGLKIPSDVDYAFSVQAGGNLVAPYAAYQEVHMYVSNEKALEYFKKRMNLRSAEQGANVILMLPYYKYSVFYDSRIIEGLRVVSDVQLYLDLHGYPIRGLEQAEHLLEKKLKPLFGKASSK